MPSLLPVPCTSPAYLTICFQQLPFPVLLQSNIFFVSILLLPFSAVKISDPTYVVVPNGDVGMS